MGRRLSSRSCQNCSGKHSDSRARCESRPQFDEPERVPKERMPGERGDNRTDDNANQESPMISDRNFRDGRVPIESLKHQGTVLFTLANEDVEKPGLRDGVL